MAEDIYITAVGGVFALLGMGVGSYLNSRSAIKTATRLVSVERHKYAQDRLWDVRLVAYTEAINMLNGMKHTTDNMSYLFAGPDADSERYLAERYEEDFQSFWNEFTKLRDHFLANTLTFSTEFMATRQAWKAAVFAIDDDAQQGEIIMKLDNIMVEWVPKFINVAKWELDLRLEDIG